MSDYDDEDEFAYAEEEEEEEEEAMGDEDGEPKKKEYDYAEDNENKLVDEGNVADRTGKPGRGLRDVSDPTENFVNRILGVCDQFEGKNFLKSGECEKIIDPIKSLPRIEFKNATTYVLGYIASKGGREITRETIANATKAVRSIETFKELITVDDIIRYAYYWKDHVRKTF